MSRHGSKTVRNWLAILATVTFFIQCDENQLGHSASLEITQPGTGDVWQIGAQEQAIIIWKQVDMVGTVRLDLYRDRAQYMLIADSIDVAEGLYTWTVPGTVEPDKNYAIHIQSSIDSSIFHQSKNFTIDPYETPATLQLLQPGMGDRWQAGATDSSIIEWSSSDVTGALHLELQFDGDLVEVITDSANIELSTYSWPVPAYIAAGPNYQIYAQSLADTFLSAFSEAFRITAAEDPVTLEMTEPAGGDRWQVGLINGATLRWIASNLTGTVRLELHQNDAYVVTIADTVAAEAGVYIWTVPDTVTDGSGFQVYIRSNEIPAVSDLGRSFRIDPQDEEVYVEILSPARGAIWYIGDTDKALIQWSYNNLAGNISIELLRQRSTIAVISESMPVEAGEYFWTVPDTIPADKNYSIFIASLDSLDVDAESDNIEISTPALTLLTPERNAEWIINDPEAAIISWTAAGVSGTIRIVLYNGRDSVLTIADSVNVAAGTFSWTVPAEVLPGSKYEIQLLSNDQPGVMAASNSFRVVAPVITLLTPDRGDEWVIDEPGGAIITWTAIGVSGTVRIVLYDGRDSLLTIADNIDVAAGIYTWTVPADFPEGSRYVVQIVSNLMPDIFAESNSFKIVTPVLTLLTPDHGDEWIINEPDNASITWTSAGLTGTIRIVLYEGRDSLLTITDDADVLDNAYLWTVPAQMTPGGQYKVHLASNDKPAITAESNSFSIVTPVITIITPDGTAVWIIGEPDNAMISWTSAGVEGTVRLELNRGKDVYLIADDISVDDGALFWTVSDSIGPERNCTVVISSNDIVLSVESDRFDLVAPNYDPVLELLTPALNDEWSVGVTQGASITWAADNLWGTVCIELLRQKAVVAVIVDSTDVRSQAFSWTVPDTIPVVNGYTVLISTNQEPLLTTESSRFNITE